MNLSDSLPETSLSLISDESPDSDEIPYVTEGTDPRILNLSYSSLLDLHSCPRRFELNKRNARSDASTSYEDQITFSYGHVVGLGMQMILEGKSYEEILWAAALEWKTDLFVENKKQNKSFASAVYAVQKFGSLYKNNYLAGFELVYYRGKPAVELSFEILLPNGFRYRGFVDAVLRHTESGEVIVLECKTSSANKIHPATYRNSAQAIGYSIVLDAIFPDLSSYKVLYLVYSTKEYEYESLPFTKTYVQRARWIRELILDVETISMYEKESLYPMRGESCMDFYRECKYLGLCQMSNENLTSPLTVAEYEKIQIKEAEYQISISLEDLIETQLTKTGSM